MTAFDDGVTVIMLRMASLVIVAVRCRCILLAAIAMDGCPYELPPHEFCYDHATTCAGDGSSAIATVTIQVPQRLCLKLGSTNP